MSVSRLRWVGQKGFAEAEWGLWNRKNDLKESGGLSFARVFGRGYNFWQSSSIETSMFINEHVLKKAPVRKAEGLEGLKSMEESSKAKVATVKVAKVAPVKVAKVAPVKVAKVAPVKVAKKELAGEDAMFKKIEAQNESIKKMQGQLMKETKMLDEFAKRED